MRFRYAVIYRLGLAVLVIAAFWAVWANAQSSNRPIAAALPSAEVSTNLFQAPMFGFDHYQFMKENEVLGQPLCKYAASIVYLVLAFLVAWFLDFGVGAWLHGSPPGRKRPMTNWF